MACTHFMALAREVVAVEVEVEHRGLKQGIAAKEI